MEPVWEANPQNRYRLRWREAVRDPSTSFALLTSLLRRKPPHSLNVRCAEVAARFSPGVSCRGSPRDLLRMTEQKGRLFSHSCEFVIFLIPSPFPFSSPLPVQGEGQGEGSSHI